MTLNPTPLTPIARQGNTTFATSVALLVLRLVLGWTFIYHGLGKVFGSFDGPGMENFTKMLEGMALPVFSAKVWAHIAAYGELLGGVSIFLGLLARLGTLSIIATMVVAIVNVVGPNGFAGMVDPVTHQWKIGYEFNLLIIAAAVVILIAGPGLISVDAFIFRRGLWARGPQPLSNPVQRP